MTLTLRVELTLDDDLYGDDEEAREWLRDILLSSTLILHENEEVGDDLGTVKVLEILP